MKRILFENIWFNRSLILILVFILGILSTNVAADNPLTFSSALHEVNIAENTPTNTIVLQLETNTNDLNYIHYSIFGDEEGFFSITPSGSLVVARPLDRESQCSSFQLSIIARNGIYYYDVSYTTVLVNIEDFPDNKPVFHELEYTISIHENQSVDVPFLTLQACTADSFPLFYSIIGGQGEVNFAINMTSGEISLASALNYELRTIHRLTVRAGSSGQPSLCDYTTVIINVLNVGEQALFTNSEYHFNISDDLPISEIFGYVFIKDGDIPCGTHDSRLLFSTNSSIILVNPLTGGLYRNGAINSSMTASIYITNQDSSQLTSVATVTVNVVSSEPIDLPLLQYDVDIQETVMIGTILTSIEMGNESGLVFEILNGDCVHGLFSVSRTSGELKTVSSPLRASNYSIAIGVSRDYIMETVFVSVRVTKAPSFYRDEYELYVSENITAGTVIYTFQSEDPDGDELTFSSSTNLPSSLSLSSSGELRVISELDRETQSNISFTVLATDDFGMSGMADVILYILDINDNTPQFNEDTYYASILENKPAGTMIQQTQASDLDENENAAVTYTLIGADEVLKFLYVSPDGEIISRLPFDHEKTPFFTVTVKAEDNGNPSRYTETVVHITIEDVPDNLPIFLEEDYLFIITKPLSANEPLLTVQAITQDNITDVVYSVENGPNLFKIDDASGLISTHTDISLTEHAGIHYLNVCAANCDLMTSVTVTIEITESNQSLDLRPNIFYVSTFPYLLPLELFLGELTTEDIGTPYEISLVPSSHSSEEFFILNKMRLSMLSTILSGIHILNVSLISGERNWFDQIEIRVNLLSNDSLQHYTSFLFPNINPQHLTQRFLNGFLIGVASLIPCTLNQLELVSVGPTSLGTQLILTVLEPDLISHMPRDEVLRRVHDVEYLSQVSNLTVIVSNDDACVQSQCANFKICRNSLSLSSTSHTFTSTTHTLISLPFVPTSSCVCPSGFNSSNNCDAEINECEPNPCYFGGECLNKINGYECICPEYTSGRDCSIPCPSASCKLCNPNPCLNGGQCSIEIGQVKCSCSDGFTGPLCELTTAHFTGDSYIEVITPPVQTMMKVSFTFITVSPNALLMYIGHFSDQDIMSVELVFGSLKVALRLGDLEVKSVITSTNGLLNDGQWHTVDIQLDQNNLNISVGRCTFEEILLANQELSCVTSIPLDINLKTLNYNTPIYFSGIPKAFLPRSNFYHFSGCIKDIYLNNALVDIASAYSSRELIPGCSPTDKFECTDECDSCISIWNGSTCSDNQNDAVSLDGSLLTLIPSNISYISNISIQFRSIEEHGVLALLGNDTAIELSYGSVIFRHFSSSSFLTLIADAYVHDGHWHTLTLIFSPSFTSLSIDNDRVSTRSSRTLNITLDYITLGGMDAAFEGFNGCLQRFKVNDEDVSLLDAVSNSLTGYHVNNTGATDGCGKGDICSASPCPENSTCNILWRDFSCECEKPLVAKGNICAHPCEDHPCVNQYDCRINANAEPICACTTPFTGLFCEINNLLPCVLRYYKPLDTCQPCPCDQRGVESAVCDDDGTCSCNENIPTFSPDGDLSCQLCECYSFGSISTTQCNKTTGQCLCKNGFDGRQCDQCLPGYAGFGDSGCYEAVVIEGSFVIENVQVLSDIYDSNTLLQTLSDELSSSLMKFALPTSQEFVLSLSEMSNITEVVYTLSSYFPRTTSILTPPSFHTLSSIVQTIIQKGRLGIYTIDPNSHTLSVDCSNLPCDVCINNQMNDLQCLQCPVGTSLDGVICRSSIPNDCSGKDSDIDGVPDSCDICPYWFNPLQSTEEDCYLNNTNNICGSDLIQDILWAPTEANYTDNRLCPSPLIGIATRNCDRSGQWEEPDLSECVSHVGDDLRKILSDITSQPPVTHNETLSIIDHLACLSSIILSIIGDLNAALSLLEHILTLDTIIPIDQEVLELLVATISELSSIRHSSQWLELQDNGASRVLEAIETIGPLVAQSIASGDRLEVRRESINMVILEDEIFRGVNYTVKYSEQNESEVKLPSNILTSDDVFTVSLTYLPTFIYSLPPTFSNLTFGSPVWTVQLIRESGQRVSNLSAPFNITFPHPEQLEYIDVSSVLCVMWDDDSGEWITNGCSAVEVTGNWSICSCSHLSSFTLFLNQSVEPPTTPQPDPEPSYSPAIFTFVALITSSVVLVIAAVLLIASSKGRNKGTFLEVWLQLLFSLILFLVVFLVGTSRTDHSLGCIGCSLFLIYMTLAVLSWFVVGAVSLLAIKCNKWNGILIKSVVSAMAWVIPLLYAGVCGVMIRLTQSSLNESFGYPHYCLIIPSLSPFLYVPGALLAGICFIMLLISLILLSRNQPPTISEIEKTNRYKTFCRFLLVLLIVFLISWVMGTVTLFSIKWSSVWHHTSEIIFALSGLLLAGTVLIAALMRIGIMDFVRFSLHLNTSREQEIKHIARDISYKHPTFHTRHRNSSLPSLPPEEPNYETIENLRRAQNHPMHVIQANVRNEIPDSDSDREVELDDLYRQKGDERYHDMEQRMDNDVFGIVDTREDNDEIFETEVDNRNIENNDEEQHPWFAQLESNPCSPIHQPFSPSSSMTVTSFPNQTMDENDDDEVLNVLYQRARASRIVPSPSPPPPPPPPLGQYVDLRIENSDSSYKFSSNLSSSEDSPWYQQIDSEISVPRQSDMLTPSLEKYSNEDLLSRPLPTIPPPLHLSSHPSLTQDGGEYTDISKDTTFTPQPRRVSKHTINTSPMHTLPGDLTLSDRSSSLPKFNGVNSVQPIAPHKRRSSAQARSSPPFKSLDRRLSHSVTRTGSVSEDSLNHHVVQLHDGSQTLQSLV